MADPLPFGKRLFCFLCCMPAGEFKIAKNGRPYYQCGACLCRIFLNTQGAVDGIQWIIARTKMFMGERHRQFTQEALSDSVPVVAFKEAPSGIAEPAAVGQAQ